ncbi:hypothetical protein COUCH_00490 [Couchioplanes caeruleus]|uniref:hypothetical protein n=1 Tax=Couchioplanes caeruleus TaxID=56438 RepID=UPI0020BEDCF2|nr:hypothetical protein [Couchioplanes caeruleus]UQU64881.1 hypothetical protein COUCH_00490 [Couchioplanes caeruleus]
MVRKIADLRAATDDELIAEHDEKAGNTHVGTAYFMEELDRRERNRAMAATEALARGAYRLTWTNTVLAAVAAVAAIIALFR